MLKKFSTEKQDLLKGKYLAGFKGKLMQEEEQTKEVEKTFLRLFRSIKALI